MGLIGIDNICWLLIGEPTLGNDHNAQKGRPNLVHPHIMDIKHMA